MRLLLRVQNNLSSCFNNFTSEILAVCIKLFEVLLCVFLLGCVCGHVVMSELWSRGRAFDCRLRLLAPTRTRRSIPPGSVNEYGSSYGDNRTLWHRPVSSPTRRLLRDFVKELSTTPLRRRAACMAKRTGDRFTFYRPTPRFKLHY